MIYLIAVLFRICHLPMSSQMLLLDGPIHLPMKWIQTDPDHPAVLDYSPRAAVHTRRTVSPNIHPRKTGFRLWSHFSHLYLLSFYRFVNVTIPSHLLLSYWNHKGHPAQHCQKCQNMVSLLGKNNVWMVWYWFFTDAIPGNSSENDKDSSAEPSNPSSVGKELRRNSSLSMEGCGESSNAGGGDVTGNNLFECKGEGKGKNKKEIHLWQKG